MLDSMNHSTRLVSKRDDFRLSFVCSLKLIHDWSSTIQLDRVEEDAGRQWDVSPLDKSQLGNAPTGTEQL